MRNRSKFDRKKIDKVKRPDTSDMLPIVLLRSSLFFFYNNNNERGSKAMKWIGFKISEFCYNEA